MKVKSDFAGRPAIFREDKPADDKIAFREMAFEVASGKTEKDKKVVRASVSSETPYFREWMWDPKKGDYIRGYEVLGHGEGEIDFSRMKDGLVIQDTHRGAQIGIMDKPEVKDRKICGEIRFGHSQQNAQGLTCLKKLHIGKESKER